MSARAASRRRMPALLPRLAPLLVPLLGACQLSFGGGTVTPEAAPPAVQVYDSQRGRVVGWSAMVERLAQADVVFLGEQHDDPTTHAAEAAVLGAGGCVLRPPAQPLSRSQ